MAGDCANPGPVENGQKSPTYGPYNHKDEIVFSCDDGYQLDGDSVLACEDTDHFNKPVPTCVKDKSGRSTFPHTSIFLTKRQH